jgi:hypothetical protein
MQCKPDSNGECLECDHFVANCPNKPTIYLASDFENVDLPPHVIKFPEAGKSPQQLQQFAASLKGSSQSYATYSLYFIRELDIQNIPVKYVNYLESGKIMESDDIDSVRDIAILDEELKQNDRYHFRE